MAFCDGSVQSISYSIDLTVYSHLGDRKDGQSIDGKNSEVRSTAATVAEPLKSPS